jgi:hypothetical protein
VDNQALLDTDPDQPEALFQPRQLHAIATRHRGAKNGCPGKQMICVNNVTVPLYCDGWKTFLSIIKPTRQDLEDLLHLELTSPLHYEPQERITTWHAPVAVDNDILLE